MEIIKKGTQDVNALETMGCCWPPMTNKIDSSAPERE